MAQNRSGGSVLGAKIEVEVLFWGKNRSSYFYNAKKNRSWLTSVF